MTDDRLKDWIRKMGYDGEIPKSLNKICSPQTSFIWEQIMTNVKPRQDVENIRKNIIIKRLKEKPLEQQREFNYPIKEIQAYLDRRELEKRMKFLESRLEEQESTNNELLKKNKVTFVAIENMKQKIKENTERKYLFEKKTKMLQENMQEAQERLTEVRNLTPVEMDETSNENEVTETLKTCAQKLQKIAEEVLLTSNRSRMDTLPLSVSKGRVSQTPKCLTSGNNFTKYLNTTITSVKSNDTTNRVNEISSSRRYSLGLPEIRLQTCAEQLQKIAEEVPPTNNSSRMDTLPLHVSKGRVSQTPECSRSSHFAKYINHTITSTNDTTYRLSETVSERDSLGLLPERCLGSSDEFDELFLVTQTKSEISSENSIENSFFNKEKKTDCDIVDRLCDSKEIKDVLKKMLHENNRSFIFKNFQNLYFDLLNQIKNSSVVYNKPPNPTEAIDQDYLSELYFIHVSNELDKEKYRITKNKLTQEVGKRTKELSSLLVTKSKNNADELVTMLQLQIEEAHLVGSNNFLSKELQCAKVMESNNDLKIMSRKIEQIKDEMNQKIGCIYSLSENVHKILEKIEANRDETSQCVRSLKPYIFDLSWASQLQADVNLKEVKTFEQFPLQYNRRLTMNGIKVPYRNIHDSTLPSDINVDSNNLETLAVIMDTPFSPAESVLLNLHQSQVKLNELRSLESSDKDISYKKCTVEELRTKEEYVDVVTNKLNSVTNSSSVQQVLAGPSQMKEIANDWMEMPVRNYISEDRSVDGHDYKYYENIFDSYYKTL